MVGRNRFNGPAGGTHRTAEVHAKQTHSEDEGCTVFLSVNSPFSKFISLLGNLRHKIGNNITNMSILRLRTSLIIRFLKNRLTLGLKENLTLNRRVSTNLNKFHNIEQRFSPRILISQDALRHISPLLLTFTNNRRLSRLRNNLLLLKILIRTRTRIRADNQTNNLISRLQRFRRT